MKDKFHSESNREGSLLKSLEKALTFSTSSLSATAA